MLDSPCPDKEHFREQVQGQQMRVSESEAIRDILLDHGDISPLLNLGSSTRHFREVSQPHIQDKLFGPIEAAGLKVFHADLKAAEGVDLVGDILDPAVVDRLAAMQFKTVLLSNLLEHVTDPVAVARACERIVGPGGHILCTVPKSYPYHPDPIDTLYRPSPARLAELFARSTLIRSTIVKDATFADDLQRKGLSAGRELLGLGVRWLTFFRRTRGLLSRTHRWLWYFRRYQTSVVLLTVR